MTEACACLRVVFKPVAREGGVLSEAWECESCGSLFSRSRGVEHHDFSTMPLYAIEALAARLGAAVKTILDARALLGGAAGVQPAQAQPHTPVVSPVPVGPPTRTGRRGQPTEAELADMQAQKAALVAQNLPDLPEELLKAERTPPP